MKTLEHDEQVAVFQWAELMANRYPELKMMFAIPNGGMRNMLVAKKLKAEGVKRGVPDICLPVPVYGQHGLFIELKAGDNKATPEQREWIDNLRGYGYQACVVTGAENCILAIKRYLGITE